MKKLAIFLLISLTLPIGIEAGGLVTTIGGERCARLLLGDTQQEVIFVFPVYAQYFTSDVDLRYAVYEAYDYKDFYTGQPLEFQDMHIDHVIPKNLSGPDNYFNYVPTVQRINGAKHARFDELGAIGVLSAVRTIYAPRIQAIIAKRARMKPKLDRPQSHLRKSNPVLEPEDYRPRKGTKIVETLTGFYKPTSKQLDALEQLHRFILSSRLPIKFSQKEGLILIQKVELVNFLEDSSESFFDNLLGLEIELIDRYSTGVRVRRSSERLIRSKEELNETVVIHMHKVFTEMLNTNMDPMHLRKLYENGAFIRSIGINY